MFKIIDKNMYIPAYDFVLKCSHLFNLLDAKGVISYEERAIYVLKIRDLASKVAKKYLEVNNL
jgi:Glycyl-tRNA synthetase, alpha subunit